MPEHRLTRLADRDLKEIFRNSIEQLGQANAEEYVLSLDRRFALLAERPEIGRSMDQIRQGYRHFKGFSHTIFYREESYGILIIRILHQRMYFKRHL